MNDIQLKNTSLKIATLLWSAILMLSVSSSVAARDYMVEVLLFENNSPSAASERHDYVAPKAMRSEASTWLLEPSMLLEDAQALRDANDYELQHHFSWGQESLPYRQSATYTVIERDTRGYIKVYADRLLFVNIDLDFKGFRMQEKRRLKLNEQHFFDHPKFGMILRVSRLEKELELEPEQDSNDISDSDQIDPEKAGELEAAR